jgi:hypothetical protein
MYKPDMVLPANWHWERFEVVDVGHGRVSLWNPTHKKFIRMNPWHKMNGVKQTWSTVWGGSAYEVGLHSRGTLSSPQAWSAKINKKDQWYQIDLGSVKMVAGFVMQKRKNYRQYVTKYKISYAEATSFKTLSTIFDGNKEAQNTDYEQIQELVTPIKARYVRFVVQKWIGHISLRAAVLVKSQWLESSPARDPTSIRTVSVRQHRCPNKDVGGKCKTVRVKSWWTPKVSVCENGQYIITHTTKSDRRPHPNGQKYVCEGSASGGWGVHQVRIDRSVPG